MHQAGYLSGFGRHVSMGIAIVTLGWTDRLSAAGSVLEGSLIADGGWGGR